MDISQYMEQAQRLLLEAFPDRLVCLGLQGSYARDEATEKSDIDLVVILDRVAAADLLVYRDILNQLPEREKSCGFFSGKGELMAWDRGELFQFFHDTRPYFGDLEFLRPLLNRRAVVQSIHTGACSIYHACVHNMLHDGSMEILQDLYKAARFVLRARVVAEGGPWCSGDRELRRWISREEDSLLERWKVLRGGAFSEQPDLWAWGESLMLWAGELLTRYALDAKGGEIDDTKSQ